jgi:hypothetical protein
MGQTGTDLRSSAAGPVAKLGATQRSATGTAPILCCMPLHAVPANGGSEPMPGNGTHLMFCPALYQGTVTIASYVNRNG